MRNRSVTIALVLLLGAWTTFFGVTTLGRPRLDTKLHRDIGRALAQEAVKLLTATGRLTVVTRDTSSFPQPAMELALASFRQEIQRSGATIADIQTIEVDPLRPVEVPPGDFFQLLRHGAVGDVIVSFMGPPLLDEEQRATLGEVKPKIVAFCSGGPSDLLNLRWFAEQKLLHAAIIGRLPKTLTIGMTGNKTPREVSFDQLYLRVGLAELLKLPDPTSVRSF